MANTLLQESNPVSLRTAMVLDNGPYVSLILLPHRSAIPDSGNFARPTSVPLYRHKKSVLAEGLFIIGVGPTHEGLRNPPPSHKDQGVIAKWLRQLAYRRFLIAHRRAVKPMPFHSRPALSLLWAESGQSVAVVANGEPWAFIHEDKKHGFSKGVSGLTICYPWDQELFERTFSS